MAIGSFDMIQLAPRYQNLHYLEKKSFQNTKTRSLMLFSNRKHAASCDMDPCNDGNRQDLSPQRREVSSLISDHASF